MPATLILAFVCSLIVSTAVSYLAVRHHRQRIREEERVRADVEAWMHELTDPLPLGTDPFS